MSAEDPVGTTSRYATPARIVEQRNGIEVVIEAIILHVPVAGSRSISNVTSRADPLVLTAFGPSVLLPNESNDATTFV